MKQAKAFLPFASSFLKKRVCLRVSPPPPPAQHPAAGLTAAAAPVVWSTFMSRVSRRSGELVISGNHRRQSFFGIGLFFTKGKLGGARERVPVIHQERLPETQTRVLLSRKQRSPLSISGARDKVTVCDPDSNRASILAALSAFILSQCHSRKRPAPTMHLLLLLRR